MQSSLFCWFITRETCLTKQQFPKVSSHKGTHMAFTLIKDMLYFFVFLQEGRLTVVLVGSEICPKLVQPLVYPLLAFLYLYCCSQIGRLLSSLRVQFLSPPLGLSCPDNILPNMTGTKLCLISCYLKYAD